LRQLARQPSMAASAGRLGSGGRKIDCKMGQERAASPRFGAASGSAGGGIGPLRPSDPAAGGTGEHGATIAAIDLGTNNCRLLIARPQAGGFVIVDAFSRIVRLGEGLAATGRLSDAAIERAPVLSRLKRVAGPATVRSLWRGLSGKPGSSSM
jgi:hypothetical protein